MGFSEAASITVPDAEGETYVVISMQPLSDIRNGRATAYRHCLMCGLTVKLRGRTITPDWRRGPTVSPGTCGAKQPAHHGPLQRLLEGARMSISRVDTGGTGYFLD
jgi:hypothetical protein